MLKTCSKQQGGYTKNSAIYTDGVAQHFAKCFARALKRQPRETDASEWKGRQIESVLVNDVLRSSCWSLEREWYWRSKSHINVLETSVVVSLLKECMKSLSGHRFNVLLDSAVAKGGLAKGRSSSKALQPLLRKAAALQLGGNLHPGYGYAPTKLNVADDPTREVDLRESSTHSLSEVLEVEELRKLHWVRVSRRIANWIRLAVLSCLLQPASSAAISIPWIFSRASFMFGFSLALLIIGGAWIFVPRLSLSLGFWISVPHCHFLDSPINFRPPSLSVDFCS